jgi:hypothetical protein
MDKGQENLGFDPMSLGEYIRMFRWITVPSSSVFFFGCLILKKSFETPGNIQPTTRRHISEELEQHGCEYLASRPSGCLRVGT